MENFWQIWLLENLPALRERHTLQMKRIKGEVTRRPEVGEVVIVKEENIPRGSWKLAKIQYLIQGQVDGIERAAKLISPFGEEFRTPLRLVYPLESRNEEAGDEETEDPISRDDKAAFFNFGGGGVDGGGRWSSGPSFSFSSYRVYSRIDFRIISKITITKLSNYNFKYDNTFFV